MDDLSHKRWLRSQAKLEAYRKACEKERADFAASNARGVAADAMKRVTAAGERIKARRRARKVVDDFVERRKRQRKHNDPA